VGGTIFAEIDGARQGIIEEIRGVVELDDLPSHITVQPLAVAVSLLRQRTNEFERARPAHANSSPASRAHRLDAVCLCLARTQRLLLVIRTRILALFRLAPSRIPNCAARLRAARALAPALDAKAPQRLRVDAIREARVYAPPTLVDEGPFAGKEDGNRRKSEKSKRSRSHRSLI
jgi:hypothetical protein